MELTANFFDEDIFTIENVYSIQECTALIERAESAGFAPASVRTKSGQKMMPRVRNNDRFNFEDGELAKEMWSRIENLLPTIDNQAPIGVDPRLRIYRYEPGQEFRRHKDGSVTNQLGDESKLSYLIYLNDDFEGGATNFRDYTGRGESRERIDKTIVPQTGLALLFKHQRWHEGLPVKRGCKYVLRSDIFYRTK